MANPEFSVIFATDVSAALLRRYLQKDGASSISVRRVAGRSPIGFKRYAIKVQCSRDADEVVRAVIEFGRLSHAT